MRTPPFLLGASLLFWGWQTGFLIEGLIMGTILEGARLVKLRWDFSDEDLARIWSFCGLVLLAAAVYSFKVNEGPADFRGFFHNPNVVTQRNAGAATARTTSSLLRWLPMTFFFFQAAQTYGTREGMPLHVISIVLRHRLKKARRLGLPMPISRTFSFSYAFFALCLFSASAHVTEDTTFFWGFCLLSAWALWPQRSPRFALGFWVALLGLIIALSYVGQRGISQFQNYLGNLNPQWLGGFTRRRFDPTQSQTEIGALGRVKTSSKIVIRLEANNGVPPRRLREATYRAFKGRTWYAQTENDFSRIAETNETTFLLLEKPTTESVKIACYLPGGKALLPLPEGVGRLDNLLAYNVWKSPLGAVLEEGPGLVVFDALYAPGHGLDAPADFDADLSRPEREQAALDQVVAELHLEGQSLDQAIQTLARFFSTQFTYSTWHDQDKSTRKTETPLTQFLLHSRSGHCEYFATAAVLLLRSINIPARYSVGYAVHEGTGQNFIVRQRDAHAWCLVWDDQHGHWRDFDPTPATWSAAEAVDVTPGQKLSDLLGSIWFEISKFRWGQSHFRQYIFWAVLPVLLLMLYQIVSRKRKRRHAASAADPDRAFDFPGLDSEFYVLEAKLAARGIPRDPSEPLWDWVQRIASDDGLMELKSVIRDLLVLHYRYRFDPQGLTRGEREQLRSQARLCMARVNLANPTL